MSSLDHFLGGGNASAAPAQEEPLAWPEQIKHLSASSIGMFRRCPEQFRFRYIQGRKERPGESIVIGSMFHEAIGWNYGQKIESHVDRPVAEVVEYLQDEAVPKVLEEEGGADEIAWDSTDAAKGVEVARRDSERMTVRYHEAVVPRIQPIALEEKLFITHPSLVVPIIGYIDVRSGHEVDVEGEPAWIADRIVDTKTGKQSSSKLKPSWMLQATIYGAMTGLPVEYHSISRAATPKIVTALESADMVFTPNEIKTRNVINSAAQISKMIAWMYSTLGPDETWPTLGRFADWSMSFSPCTNCGYRKECPAMDGEV
jgi:RecB family exonuclease